MDYYDLINEAFTRFRKSYKRGKIPFNLKDISEFSKLNCVVLTLDTDDGIATSNAPYLVFKVIIPFDDFSPTSQPIDDEMPTQGITVKTTKSRILLRVGYRMLKAFKEAVQKIDS